MTVVSSPTALGAAFAVQVTAEPGPGVADAAYVADAAHLADAAYLADVAPVDLIGAAMLLVFALLGAWRGLWWQAMRLAGMAGAVVAARAFTPTVAPSLMRVLPDLDPRLATGLVWLVLFLAGLGVATLLGRIGRRLLEAMQLGLVDRFGGLVAGALTGLLLHAALVAALLQLAPARMAQDSVRGTRSEVLVRALVQPLPLLFDGDTSERVRRLLAAPPSSRPEPSSHASPTSQPKPSSQPSSQPKPSSPP